MPSDAVLKLVPDPPMDLGVARNRGDSVAKGSIPSGSVRAKRARAPGKQRSSILIVAEDAELSRRYVRSFAAYGYLVDLAPDRETAFHLAESKQFDAVVTDLDMPGNPLETIKDLRQQQNDLALVMLSNRLAFDSARAAVECGADRYLLKPVSGEELAQALALALADESRGKR